MSFTIGLSRPEELEALAQIEARAATLFDDHPVTAGLPLVDSPPTAYEHSHEAGLLWVARDEGGRPVGFALCERMDGEIHLEELDVDPEFGRRGIGRTLVEHVCAYAAERGMDVTLTTFRGVAWNEPFYASLGFREIRGAEVGVELARRVRAEAERGLPVEVRVVMRRGRVG